MTNPQRYSMPLSPSSHFPEAQNHQFSQSSADRMSPSSALLQDLLREKKASQHARRTSHQSDYATYERQVQSSPIAPPAVSQPRKASDRRTSGYAAPKEMGLREMEDYISKINKQNFDLKLEIFHRRQRSEALEAKAEKAEQTETQNDELRQINEDLLLELERRDVAVEEAVALICDLEARIDQLEAERSGHAGLAPPATAAGAPERPVTPLPSHGAPRTPALDSTIAQDSIPNPSLHRTEQGRRDEPLLRSPSFLRDDKPSTSALRGLFQRDGGSATNGVGMAKPSVRSLRRADSFWSQDEYSETVDGDTFSLNPRRLSLLSESSFVSVYGKNKEKLTPSIAGRSPTAASPTREEDFSFSRRLSPQEGRIRSWIENKDHPASPSKRPATIVRPDTFSSIGEIIGPDQPSSRDVRPPVSPTPSKKHHRNVPPQLPGTANYKSSFAGPIFGSDVLPPTPGTMSTTTLGEKSSNPSIVTGRSLGGTSQRSSGSTAIADDDVHGASFAGRSLRSEAVLGFSQAYPNDETDIEVSGDERHSIQTVPSTKDANRHGFSNMNSNQRPALASHVTNYMSNGGDIDTIRPANTISYPSPRRSYQSASQDSARSSGKASSSSKGRPEAGDRTSSAKQVESATLVEPNKPPRPLPSRSKSSHAAAAAAQAPTQNFASRLFRRNTNHPAAHPPSSTRQPPTTASPETKPRLPRPSSSYLRSTSSHSPSAAAPLQVSRVGRQSGPPVADSRRHSVSLDASHNKDSRTVEADDGVTVGQQKQTQQQQQSKRLSVGAIGRSASLKIKEGFGRKKVGSENV